jgi:hypothetical protein
MVITNAEEEGKKRKMKESCNDANSIASRIHAVSQNQNGRFVSASN